MVRVDDLKIEINDILERVAENLHIKDYEVKFNIKSDKGDGFLGEFFMASVIDKENNKENHIAIKKAMDDSGPTRSEVDLPLAYKNENYFYSTVFPALDKFQRDRGVKCPLASVPKYFFGSSKLNQESVVMENLIYSGFQLHDKIQPLSEQQIELILKTYGKFHALSFAYKDQQSKEYNELVSKLADYYKECLMDLHDWGKEMNESGTTILNCLKSRQLDDVAKNFEPLGKDMWSIYRDVCIYKGQYKGVLHGDCWSNNMMFKYDDRHQLVDMRMLDFQLAREATPVFDISYFLYAGGSKEAFDQLDHYLDIYYASFSEFAKKLGSDPQKIYPIEELMKDWKEYAKFGVIMGLMVLSVRTQKKEEIERYVTQPKGLEVVEEQKTEEQKKEIDYFFLNSATDIVVHSFKKVWDAIKVACFDNTSNTQDIVRILIKNYKILPIENNTNILNNLEFLRSNKLFPDKTTVFKLFFE